MSATRVIAPGARKIGGGAPAQPPPETPEPAPKRRGRGLLLVLVLLGLLGGAAAYLLLPASDSAADVTEPEPGIAVAVEPRNINLAEGRYLRLGFTIQLAEGAEEIPTAQAIDIAIDLYSGRSVAETNDPEQRAALAAELTERLVAAYGEEVLTVYLTDYVTQ